MSRAADFNGDGKQDLATANDIGSDNVSVLLGNGNGTFAAEVDYPVGSGVTAPSAIAAADLNGDGKPDLAVAYHVSQQTAVSVLLNTGNGTFAPKIDFSTGSVPTSVFPTLDRSGGPERRRQARPRRREREPRATP